MDVDPTAVTFEVTFARKLRRNSQRSLRVDVWRDEVVVSQPGASLVKRYLASGITRMEPKGREGLLSVVLARIDGGHASAKRFLFRNSEDRSYFCSLVRGMNRFGMEAKAIHAALAAALGAMEPDSPHSAALQAAKHCLESRIMLPLSDEVVREIICEEPGGRYFIPHLPRILVWLSSQQSSVVRHIVSASRHRISTPHSRPGSDAGTASDVPPPAGADGGASSVESEAPLGTDAPSPSLPLAPSALATAAAATGPAAAASQAGALRLLPGETLVQVAEGCSLQWFDREGHERNVPGTLLITNFQLLFCSYQDSAAGVTDGRPLRSAAARVLLRVPLAAISRCDSAGRGGAASSVVVIRCKDLRVIKLMFDATSAWVSGIVQLLRQFAFRPTPKLFAFTLARFPRPNGVPDGWQVFDVEREFVRQGALESAATGATVWQLMDNSDYSLCPTYPSKLVVPACFAEELLRQVAAFRSKARLPVLTWRNPRTGAVLARSSQPLIGVSGHRSHYDEHLLNIYRRRGDRDSRVPDATPFHIFDARKQVAAEGNRVRRGGVENESNYVNTHVTYLGIENIHAMRDSLNKLAEICAPGSVSASDSTWLQQLHNTQWLRHVRGVLRGALRLAEVLEEEVACALVHCSDGWDRTPQVAATAQLLLDPYYRTLEGFAVLVEKEWCAFGHKFQDRVGHGDGDHADHERSPIFLQWLDVVWQVVVQFPRAFEFAPSLLRFLADALYSCQFGTFLGNCEKGRMEMRIADETWSVWSVVLSEWGRARWGNPAFSPSAGALWPSASPKRVRLWETYFLRFDPSLHGAWAPEDGKPGGEEDELEPVVALPREAAAAARTETLPA